MTPEESLAAIKQEFPTALSYGGRTYDTEGIEEMLIKGVEQGAENEATAIADMQATEAGILSDQPYKDQGVIDAELAQLQSRRDAAEAAMGQARSGADAGFTPATYQASELYGVQQQELQQALDRQMRAAGMSGSGQAAKMAAEQQRALGAEEQQRYLNRLQGMTAYGANPQVAQGSTVAGTQGIGMGFAPQASGGGAMTAAQGMGGVYTNTGNAMGKLYGDMGAAQAGGIAGAGAAQAQMYGGISQLGGDIFSNYMNRQTYGNSGMSNTQLPQGGVLAGGLYGYGQGR